MSSRLRALLSAALLTTAAGAHAVEPGASPPGPALTAHFAVGNTVEGHRAYSSGFSRDFFRPAPGGIGLVEMTVRKGANEVLSSSAVELIESPLAVMREAGCLAHDVAFRDWTDPPDTVQGQPLGLRVENALSADFSSLVTRIVVQPSAPGAARSRPLLELVIASDRLQPAAKTDADKQALVAREKARVAALGLPALVKKANAGDADARQDAYPLSLRHKRRMREAREDEWAVYDAAWRRAQMWSENGCARLHDAMRANAAETPRLLERLVAGELDGELPDDWERDFGYALKTGMVKRNLEPDPAKANERRVYRDGKDVLVSRRAGDAVVVDYRLRRYQPTGDDPAQDSQEPSNDGE